MMVSELVVHSTENSLWSLISHLALITGIDMVLRKMFTRVLKMALPSWSIKEASNGETALKIVESEKFDVIFIDQVRTPLCCPLHCAG